jgi:hypothetical protein
MSMLIPDNIRDFMTPFKVFMDEAVEQAPKPPKTTLRMSERQL